MIATTLLYVFGLIVVVGTLLPLSKSSSWWIRLCDFPRFQIFVLGLAVGVGLVLSGLDGAADVAVLSAVVLSCAWQLSWFWRYLPLAPLEVKNADGAEDNAAQISLMTSNVLQTSRDV